jgi:hypothetical protein
LQQAKRPDQIQSHEKDKGQRCSLPNVPGKTETMKIISKLLALIRKNKTNPYKPDIEINLAPGIKRLWFTKKPRIIKKIKF